MSGAAQKWELPTRFEEKKKRQSEKLANQRDVYRQVDRRDGFVCRAYGVKVRPSAVSLLERAHRHHIKFRSQGGQDTTANLVTLSPAAHAEIHAWRLHILSDDANQPLTFEQAGKRWTS